MSAETLGRYEDELVGEPMDFIDVALLQYKPGMTEAADVVYTAFSMANVFYSPDAARPYETVAQDLIDNDDRPIQQGDKDE
jgi:hypothetical protein